jgi:hypothetical protein
MKKYLVLAIYLLTMIAIYHHPITLSNDGSPPTVRAKENFVHPNAPMNLALETMSSKAGLFELTKEKEKIVSGAILTSKMKKK